MKKYIKSIFLCVFCFAMMFGCFNSNKLAEKNLAQVTFADNAVSPVSIFIRKPTYSVFYNEKLYFIDEADNLLKVYDASLHSFIDTYIDISNFEVIGTSFAENSWFLLVKKDTENKLVRVNLDTLQIEKEYDFLIESVYDFVFVKKITFSEKTYMLATFSARSQNTKIAIIDENDGETKGNVSTFEMKFKTEDSLQTEVKTNLNKTISYQDINGRLYIVFIYNSNIAYYAISSFAGLTELETKDISAIQHTAIPQTDSENLIANVGLATINSVDYLAISYKYYNNDEIIKIYSFNLDSGTETINYTTQFPCKNSREIIFNGDYYSYVDQQEQKLFFTKITSETTSEGVVFGVSKTEVDNPNYTISYLTEDEFVYKQANKITALFDDPWGAVSANFVSKDYDVIKIGYAVLDNNTEIRDYDYCLFTNNNRNYCGFIKTDDLTEKDAISVKDAGFPARVSVWPKSVLYSLPTTTTKGQIGTTDCLLFSKRIMQIEDNSELEVLDVLCGYSAGGTKMLKVKVNGNNIGFIEAKCVRTPSNVVDFVITNATIKKDDTTVYLSASSDATTLTFKLNKGKNIRINGKRDTKSGFTSITFNDEYGNEFTGFIETDYLKADAWSTLQIVGCVLIAINIGLLILILLFKKNRLGSRGQKITDDTQISV